MIIKKQKAVPTQIIINKEIKLKQVVIENAKDIFDVIEKNREIFTKTMDWVMQTKTYLDSEKFILWACEEWESKSEYTYCIYFEDKVVGMFSLRRQGRDFAIGYNLDKRFSGKGIVTIVVSEVTKYLQEKDLCEKIYIKCSIHNTKSNNVAKRAGYYLVSIIPKGEVINGEYHDQNLYISVK